MEAAKRRPFAVRVLRHPPLWVAAALLAAAWNPFDLVVLAEFTQRVERAGRQLTHGGIAVLVLLGVVLGLLPVARRRGGVWSALAHACSWALAVAVYLMATYATHPFRELEWRSDPVVVSPDGRFELAVIRVRGASLIDPDWGHRVVLRTRYLPLDVQRDVLTVCTLSGSPRAPRSVRFLDASRIEIVEESWAGTRTFHHTIEGGRMQMGQRYCP